MKEETKKSWMKVLRNKYFITLLLFVVWMMFFDEYSMVASQKNRKQLRNLTEQLQYYQERIKAENQKLKELNSGIQELEKYAREQLYMAKPNEDLFVVMDEE
jgi:cell division protein DivIC